MPKAIRIHETGGPDVLRFEEYDPGPPPPGWVLIRHTAVGLNFIDTYHRSGLYPLPLPCGLGLEAAGVVETVGEGVTSLRAGDRIAYGTGPIGAYSQVAIAPANRLVKIPDAVSDEIAAAMMLKGMTAWFLLRRTYEVKQGETIVVHAAAGGVGMIACQWARHLGATVIGTVGSDDKVELSRAHGADHVIVTSREDISRRVRELTEWRGVPVVYDGIGRATFEASLDCLAPRGLLVSFGNASGPPPPLELQMLALKGSLFVTRPTLMTYTAEDADLQEGARALFDVVASGAVRIDIHQRYALHDAAQAHRDLESRKTTGATVLLP